MGTFEAAPSEIREVGARVRAFGPSIQGAAADLSSVAGTVSEPTQTASALSHLAAEWHAGISRLADDVQIFGGLAQIAANGYETVDENTMPWVVTPVDGP